MYKTQPSVAQQNRPLGQNGPIERNTLTEVIKWL